MKTQRMHEALQRAIAATGSQSAFARICGCTQGNIWQLVKAGRPLPAQYVLRVEAATSVSRHELRPDLYPAANHDPAFGGVAVCGVCNVRAEWPEARSCTHTGCGLAERQAA